MTGNIKYMPSFSFYFFVTGARSGWIWLLTLTAAFHTSLSIENLKILQCKRFKIKIWTNVRGSSSILMCRISKFEIRHVQIGELPRTEVILSKQMTLFMILLQFQTILFPYKLFVTEKSTYLNKGCNIENPYVFCILIHTTDYPIN